MYNFILTASRNDYAFLLAIPVLIVFVQGNPTGIDKPYSNSYSNYAGPIQSSFFSSSSSPPLPAILPKSIADVNFVAVGDWDCSPDTLNTVKNIKSKNPEMILSLGDNSYETTADCWLKIVDPIDEKMKIVIGNHDTESESLLTQYTNHFNLTRQYYSFNHKNVHFLVMSTQLPYQEDSRQYTFVRNDLAHAASDPDVHWIIVSFHKLAYTSMDIRI